MNRGVLRTAITLIALVILVLVAKFGSFDKSSVPRATPSDQTGRTVPASPPKSSSSPVATTVDPLSRVATDSAEREQIEVTLRLIDSKGPFPHKRDGIVFNNREGRLPRRPRGYYHEYTVETPGSTTRGARRIIRGDGGETFYSRDHYATFVRIDEGGSGDR